MSRTGGDIERLAAARDVEGLLVTLRDKGSQRQKMAAFALADSDGQVREAAALALGELRDPRAETSLRWALKDEDGEVRAAAAEALGKLRSEGAFQVGVGFALLVTTGL